MHAEPAVVVPTKQRYSLARVLDHWYIACASHELGSKPLARTIFDTPLVLFRSDNGPVTLLDRCAHRNVPLSLGRVEKQHLVCGYHGWAFDGAGQCQQVPALCSEQTGKARRVPAFATREQQGFIWVYMRPDVQPEVQPFEFPHVDSPGYGTVRHTMDFRGTLHATLENILDVPHTAFLHRGFFRGVTRNRITVKVQRGPDRVEAEYLGEPVPTGVMGRILAPQGGTVGHYDRFIMPSVAQVEYQLGAKNHIMISSALTPIRDFETRLHAVATFRTVFPAPILKAVLTPIGKHVLKQDYDMLSKQTDAVQHFGGEQYVHTDVDVLGAHILRLLKRAERGEGPFADTETFETELLA